MVSSAPATVAFIGFGEVGQTFARGLLANGANGIHAFDRLFGQTEGQRLEAAARSIGVGCAASAEAVGPKARFVFSAVTADRTEAVAIEAARWLRPGQVFVDVNSAAPLTKQRAAKAVEASGADYIEAAVMAPVLKPGLKVSILTGGPKAQSASEALNALGMNLTPVSDVVGRASAMKLCRSIVIKGLEALMVDCAAACEAWDVKDPVFASLNATFPSIDFHALDADMSERVATHGIRRAAEMREAAEMLAAAKMDPGLAHAVADAQQRGARSKGDA
ncbi:NAD(P)-dependent oxidoreductase [Methylobacterium sp. CCH7-A2]|jgi:3-hydroxyisobutyrate dehydrogenase-like beta-hydroxyacid dehydrogenase|uniref:NAD(P)-dependent oxidoreductase n=1 Tax=Methylobacterium sp. CCH7-A2 TaxID=1768789 RepID=UPI00082E3537|nr:NAD(P)-dependent oxidoreductase [Methylobacterium sp. CCH7-A2]